MGKHLPIKEKRGLTRLVLGGMNITKAGKQYGVPHQTANDIVNRHMADFFFFSERTTEDGKPCQLSDYRKKWAEIGM